MSMTMKEFCDGLRQAAGKLASGEIEFFHLRDGDLEMNLSGDDLRKVRPSYIRTIMNRVAGVKELGTVKITRADGIEMAQGYVITINRDVKRRVFNEKDLPAIRQKAVEKAINHVLGVMPNVADLDGDQLQGAAIAIKRYQDLIKSIISSGE